MNLRQRFPYDVRVPRRAESGQAIVLLALVMLGLVAMLGLAIDGGGLYLLWRSAQNATDAAALAGSYAKCTKGGIDQAVKDAAAKNGFNNDGVTNFVSWYNPPRAGSEKAGDPNYIEVEIIAFKPAYFIQVVYREPLKVTNTAVGVCDPPFDPTTLPGVWAGSKTCQNSIKWGGSRSDIWGGLFSNFQVQFKGSNITFHDLKITLPDGTEVIYPGKVEAVNRIDPSMSDKITWADSQDKTIIGRTPTGIPSQDDPVNVDWRLYAPGGAIYEYIKKTTGRAYDVANDPTIPDWNPSKLEWTPGKTDYELHGLYYVHGKEVNFGSKLTFNQANGFTIVVQYEDGDGVSRYGTINAGNTALQHMTYYKPIMTPLGPRKITYPGLIFYAMQDDRGSCGSNALKFSGPTWIEGVLYAPHGGFQVSGSYMYLHGSIIVDNLDWGASEGDMIYYPQLVPGRPPAIHVVE